jgi:hypothetical protein
MIFSPNWISLAVVVVDVSKPATPVGASDPSKMSVLSYDTGAAKFAWFKMLQQPKPEFPFLAFPPKMLHPKGFHWTFVSEVF